MDPNEFLGKGLRKKNFNMFTWIYVYICKIEKRKEMDYFEEEEKIF